MMYHSKINVTYASMEVVSSYENATEMRYLPITFYEPKMRYTLGFALKEVIQQPNCHKTEVRHTMPLPRSIKLTTIVLFIQVFIKQLSDQCLEKKLLSN